MRVSFTNFTDFAAMLTGVIASDEQEENEEVQSVWALFHDLFYRVPGASEYGAFKVALRMTTGPTNACISFHCDGSYASSTSQIALNDPAEYDDWKL